MVDVPDQACSERYQYSIHGHVLPVQSLGKQTSRCNPHPSVAKILESGVSTAKSESQVAFECFHFQIP